MKITLVNPPFVFPVTEEFSHSQILGLRYLSAYLKSRGPHRVEILDALHLGFSHVQKYYNGYQVGLETADLVSRISGDTDLIGVSVPFSQLAPVAHQIVAAAKARLPRVPIILGGVYPSSQPELALSSRADWIVVGEGEDALYRIAAGENPGEIKGVYGRGGTLNPPFVSTNPLADLDSLPFPDDALPEFDRYLATSPRLYRKHLAASIITSRGCPFSCEYCSIHSIYGKNWRSRSAENVLAEIDYWNTRHGVTYFEIEDDNFTLNRERAALILEGIIRFQERGRMLLWSTPNGVRIDTLDEELIRLIKRARCINVTIGLEHGSPEMIRLMNKRLDLEKAFETIRLLTKHKIPVISLFIIVGFPGETPARFDECVRYLREVKKLGGNFEVYVNIAQPYPGTRLRQQCLDAGYISNRSLGNFLVNPNLMSTSKFITITTEDFDAPEVLRRKKTIEKMFDRPISRRLKRIKPLYYSVRFAKDLIRSSRDAYENMLRKFTGKVGKSNKC